jgi:hypothetical protein
MDGVHALAGPLYPSTIQPASATRLQLLLGLGLPLEVPSRLRTSGNLGIFSGRTVFTAGLGFMYPGPTDGVVRSCSAVLVSTPYFWGEEGGLSPTRITDVEGLQLSSIPTELQWRIIV